MAVFIFEFWDNPSNNHRFIEGHEITADTESEAWKIAQKKLRHLKITPTCREDLRCPFCGGEGIFLNQHKQRANYLRAEFVRCGGCQIETTIQNWYRRQKNH